MTIDSSSDAQSLRTRQQSLREALPFLIPLAEKVARVHGNHVPELIAVNEHLAALAEDLVDHLDHEQSPIRAAEMKAEHAHLLETLERVRDAAGDYAVPEWACRSYLNLMRGLERFDAQLKRQVELEEAAMVLSSP